MDESILPVPIIEEERVVEIVKGGLVVAEIQRWPLWSFVTLIVNTTVNSTDSFVGDTVSIKLWYSLSYVPNGQRTVTRFVKQYLGVYEQPVEGNVV